MLVISALHRQEKDYYGPEAGFSYTHSEFQGNLNYRDLVSK